MNQATDQVYISHDIPKSICKIFSRLNISISNYAFDADVIWCRVVFSKYENWNIARHSHSFYELHLCLSGNAKFENKKREILNLLPGEFVIFPPGETHRLCNVSDDFSKLVFGFALKINKSDEYAFLKTSFDKIAIKVYKASDTMLEAPKKILNDIRYNHLGFKLMANQILSTVIIDTARIIHPFDKISSIKYENKDKRLDAVILYMQDNLHRQLTLEDFAAVSAMSPKQLNRIMMESYNMSVAKFFKKEKIEKAKDLLIHTELSISQIAQKIGFSDEFSMSKTFKRIEGMTPAKYRLSYFLK